MNLFHGLAHGLQCRFRNPFLELLVDKSKVRISFFPHRSTMMGKKYVIDAQIRRRRFAKYEILFLHGLDQTGKSSFGTIGDKGQIILDQSVLIMEILENDELLLGKIDSMILHIIGNVIIDELGGFANPWK